MRTLHVLSGPCGAGKTTRAAELAARGAAVVSWDLLWPHDSFPGCSDAQFQMRVVKRAVMLLQAGAAYVVVDAHNLLASDRITWETVAFVLGAAFIFERLETPYSECVERDALRSRPVGEEWIAHQFSVMGAECR